MPREIEPIELKEIIYPTNKVGIVGMVHVSCPACGEDVETDIRVKSVEHRGGNYMVVQFMGENPSHECLGRRH